MKKILLLQVLIFVIIANSVAVSASNDVLISQVLYDPVDESGGEAVELYNAGSLPVDISGWIIVTETSSTDAVIPANTTLSSGSYYLIADTGWSSTKETAWPLADHEEALTLTNTDAGVALNNRTDIIDAVGWGNAANIQSSLYEGTPHGDVDEGKALVRKVNGNSYVDTDNNLNDFTIANPDFHNSSFNQNSKGSEGSAITVIAVVKGSLVINSLNITDDDPFTDGNQVYPVPKQNKSVEIEAIANHDSSDNLDAVSLTIDGKSFNATLTPVSSTSTRFNASFNLSYHKPAGEYDVLVVATTNNSFSVNTTTTFQYTSLTAMELDTDTLEFAALPGSVSEIAGDNDETTTSNTTIKNIGNSVLNIQLSGTNLTSDNKVIDVSNIQYTFNGNYNNSLAGNLSSTMTTRQVAVAAAGTIPLSFRLNVPVATSPGNYTGRITLVAVEP